MPLYDDLITTKLIPPPTRTRLIERGLLLEQLSAGKDCPLMVISSAAGSGKTSLVCQWLQKANFPVAWYSLDEGDNQPDLFFQYFAAAVMSFGDGFVDGKDAAHHGIHGSPTEKTAYDIINRLVDLKEDVYLILDDYQFITAQEIHDALTYLLDHMPRNMHLVILSRYRVPLPIPRLKVRHQVTEITAADMQFTEKETLQYFTEMFSISISEDEIAQLINFSEGWVGGLQLLGLSLNKAKVSDRLHSVVAGAKQDTYDYLVNEVIECQPEKVKAFIEATVLLDRFNAQVAVKLTGMSDAGQMIDQIYRNNLFLIPLDNERQWYRYHHLFSQAVRERIGLTRPEYPVQVHQQAAIWFAENGWLEDAFRNAFASGNVAFTAELLEDYLLDINDRYEYASGRRWIAMLPGPVVKQRMLLRLHDCGQKIEALQLSDVESVINDIEADVEYAFGRYQGPKRRLCEDLYIYFSYALRCYYRDPNQVDVKQLEKAFDLISSENQLFSGYIMILLTLTHLASGDSLKADAALTKASHSIMSSGSVWARVFWFRLKSVVERVQGNLYRSDAVLKDALDYLSERNLEAAPLTSALHLPMAWVCYQRNDLDPAFEFASDAVRYGERVKFIRDLMEGNLLLALVHCARGNKKQALVHIEKMRQVAEQWPAADLSVSAAAWVVRLYLLMEEFDECDQWLRRHPPTAEQDFSLAMIQEKMNLAKLFEHKKKYTEALTLLAQLRLTCVDHGLFESVLEIDLIRCGVLHQFQRHDEARDVLENALNFGKNEGYIRPFINHARGIGHVLSRLGAETPESSRSPYLNTLLSDCGCKDRISDGLEGSLKTKLTPRELEVLQYLVDGYQYKKIAQKIFVSYETVKTHVQHIYEKLNVNSRHEAVRKARGLKLLSS